MSTLKTNNVQVGQSVTATNNFTLYQPATPDGTVRLGVGNSGATTADVVTANSSGNVGIGTTLPAEKFVVSNAGANGIELVPTISSGAESRIQSYNRSGAAYTPLSFDGQILKYLTGGTERARIDASGNFQFNSGYGSVATAYGCRAWVNFNGNGAVPIRGAGNVSSITDEGVGSYRVNFTNPMPDTNYCAQITPGYSLGESNISGNTQTFTTTSVNMHFRNQQANIESDTDIVCVAIFR